MASTLSPIPRLIFTILEPLSLLAGFLAPVLKTSKFVSSQLPSSPDFKAYTLTPTNRILALQLANVYGLVGIIGVGVLYSTSESRVVRNYLIACALGDLGHIWFTYTVMGHEDFFNVLDWNGVAWGNIGITAMLFVSRLSYLAGVLGKDRPIKNQNDEQGLQLKIN